MNQPCDNCPFRSDVPAYITAAFGRDIVRTVLEGDGIFPCHKTVDYSHEDDDGHCEGQVTKDSQWCTGALILMEKTYPDQGGASRNQMVRIYGRFGGLDLDALNMDAPVHANVTDWLDYLRRGER